MIQWEELDEKIMHVIYRELKFPGTLHFRNLSSTEIKIYFECLYMLGLDPMIEDANYQYEQWKNLKKSTRNALENLVEEFLKDFKNNTIKTKNINVETKQKEDKEDKEEKYENNNDNNNINNKIKSALNFFTQVTDWYLDEDLNPSQLRHHHHHNCDHDYDHDRDIEGESDGYDFTNNNATDVRLHLNIDNIDKDIVDNSKKFDKPLHSSTPSPSPTHANANNHNKQNRDKNTKMNLFSRR
jgi:hypothetical protein